MGSIDAIVTGFMLAHPAAKVVLGILTGGLIYGRGRGWWSKGSGPRV